jgi:hypothetical protein
MSYEEEDTCHMKLTLFFAAVTAHLWYLVRPYLAIML